MLSVVRCGSLEPLRGSTFALFTGTCRCPLFPICVLHTAIGSLKSPVYMRSLQVRLPPVVSSKSSTLLLQGTALRGEARHTASGRFRVDGNDTLAMYSAMKAAREMAVSEERPVLLEVRHTRICFSHQSGLRKGTRVNHRRLS